MSTEPLTARVPPRGRLLALVAGVATAVGVFLHYAPSVSTLLLASLGFAYLLDPVVDALEGREVGRVRLGRTTSILILLAATTLVLVAAVLLLGPRVQAELRNLVGVLGQALEGTRELAEWLAGRLGLSLDDSLDAWFEQLGRAVREVPEGIKGPVAHLLGRFFQSTVSVLLSVLNLALFPVFAFYLLRDIDPIKAFLADLIPTAQRPTALRLLGQMDEALSAFVRGQLTVCTVLAVLYGIGLSLLGLNLAWLIGMAAGLGNIVPYLGTALGIASALGVGALQFAGDGLWLHLGGIALVFAVVQMLEGLVITPKVVGDKLGLHPLAVIVALMAFGELFGFVGVLLGVPMAAVVKVLATEGIARYRGSPFLAAAAPAAGEGGAPPEAPQVPEDAGE